MIKSRFGTDLDRILQRLFPFLFRARIDPNALTWIGTAVSGLAAFAIATGELLVGGLLILAGGFFDLVDGVVARHAPFHPPQHARRLVEIGLAQRFDRETGTARARASTAAFSTPASTGWST